MNFKDWIKDTPNGIYIVGFEQFQYEPKYILIKHDELYCFTGCIKNTGFVNDFPVAVISVLDMVNSNLKTFELIDGYSEKMEFDEDMKELIK